MVVEDLFLQKRLVLLIVLGSSVEEALRPKDVLRDIG
jgi:hypothetical protein